MKAWSSGRHGPGRELLASGADRHVEVDFRQLVLALALERTGELQRDRALELGCGGAGGLQLRAQIQVELAAVDLLLAAEGLVDELLGALVGARCLVTSACGHAERGHDQGEREQQGQTASAKSGQGDLSFRRSAVDACELAGARATGACGENEGQHTEPNSPMRWSGHITKSRFRGAIPAVAATLAALRMYARRCLRPRPGAARKPDPVRTTIDRALAAGRIDAEQRAAYVASYSAARRTLRATVGTAAGRARLRPRHGAIACAPEAPHRAPAADVPDPRPQPGVVGEGGTAGLGSAADLRREPRDLPVLPRQGAAAPSAGQLRQAERLLAGAQERRSALPCLRTW